MQFAGILLIVPAVLGAVLGETRSATGIFLSFVAMSFTGFVLNAYGEKTPMNLRQTTIVMVLSFVLLSLFGSFPFMYLNPFLKEGNIESMNPLLLFVDSFFESASGFTTTGISTIVEPQELPASFVFYRAYILLIGGLSFVYLVIALFYPKRRLAPYEKHDGRSSYFKTQSTHYYYNCHIFGLLCYTNFNNLSFRWNRPYLFRIFDFCYNYWRGICSPF